MNSIMVHIFKMSVFSSIMILAVMGVRRAFKDRLDISIISFMWLVVLARLLMPFTLTSPINIGNVLFNEVAYTQTEAVDASNPSQQSTDYNALDHNLTYSYDSKQSLYEQNGNEYIGDTQNKVEVSVSVFEKCLNYLKSISLMMYTCIIWLAGVCVFLTVNICRMISFCRKANANKQPVHNDIREIFQKNKTILGIKKDVKLIVGNHLDLPVTFGLVKPKILISTKLVKALDRQKIDLIIMHELCHIKRWDIAKTYLWMMARAVHWFNPLIRLAFRMYQNDIEFACDNMVINKLNHQERIEYSQSLIDVIRISQCCMKAPLAAPFYKEKSKIGERVMNMLNPQKKSKRAGLISILLVMLLLIPCFTTACQPTPESSIVQNKSDDDLQNAIEQTADPSTDGSQYTSIKDTRTNDTGTITVDIDATVLLPGDDNVTVARLERVSFTQEQVDTMIQVFFGDNLTFYDPYVSTKEDIQASILYQKQRLMDEEALLNSDYAIEEGITDLDVIRAYVNEKIKELEKQYEDVPDKAPVIEAFDIDAERLGISADVDFGGDYMGRASYNESYNTSRQSITCYAFDDESNRLLQCSTSTQIDANSNAPEFIVAKQAAQKLIDDMGIEGVQVGDMFISLDNTGDMDEEFNSVLASDRQFYVFCFERIVGERTIDFSFYGGGYTGDDEVTVTVPYEQIQVWVEGDNVVKFLWFNPFTVTEIENDNTAVQIGYKEALDSAVNQIYYTYSNFEAGFIESVSVVITSIEFDMVRLKEKDAEDYISVPVWKIYGSAIGKYSTEFKQEHNISEDSVLLNSQTGPNIVTVNALDGSIIDMQKGY